MQVVLGMEVAAISSDTALSILLTVSSKMVVRRVWDNALKSPRMEHVAAPTMRSNMSALVLHLAFAARNVASAALILCTVAGLVKASLGHAWHRARMGLAHGREDIRAWVVSSESAARDIPGVETLRSIAVWPKVVPLVVSTIQTSAFALSREWR